MPEDRVNMSQVFNVYCDESCHLEHDRHDIMVLGAVWCPLERTHEIAVRVREIKQEHELPSSFEIKWGKVSPAKVQFYLDILDYFFDDDDLHFRALIAQEKSRLHHEEYQQTHDEWYYKMYFDMLKIIFEPTAAYRIYIDIKDTRGGEKVDKLHRVLCNNFYDFSAEMIERVQIVRSDRIEQVQLADLLIGAISYVNRGLNSSSAKVALVERMRRRSGYSLTRTTLFREDKVNLFFWRPS